MKEDMAWVLQDPGRRAALQQAWAELQRGDVIRPPRSARPSVDTLRRLARKAPRAKART
jgi:hypothetical protein